MKNGETSAAIAVAPYARPDLRIGEVQRLSEVRAHRDEPDAPDEVLEEHHRRELRAHAVHGSVLMRMLRNAERAVVIALNARCIRASRMP